MGGCPSLNSLRKGFLAVDSEAMQIEHRIFMTMNAEVREKGKFFVVVVVPTATDLLKLPEKEIEAINRTDRPCPGAMAPDGIPAYTSAWCATTGRHHRKPWRGCAS